VCIYLHSESQIQSAEHTEHSSAPCNFISLLLSQKKPSPGTISTRVLLSAFVLTVLGKERSFQVYSL